MSSRLLFYIGDLVVLSYIIPLVLFITLYAKRRTWRYSTIGRTLMAQKAAFLVVMLTITLQLFQGKQMAQTGSRFEAVQVIGAARLYARCLGVPFITQSPQILRLTEMHMHWPRHAENSHIPDHLSAQLHLLHYAETQGISTTRLRKLNPDILHP